MINEIQHHAGDIHEHHLPFSNVAFDFGQMDDAHDPAPDQEREVGHHHHGDGQSVMALLSTTKIAVEYDSETYSLRQSRHNATPLLHGPERPPKFLTA